MTPACSRTCRWWASRLDGMASRAASSDGEASPASRVSAICSRAGSASAAWIANRRTRSEVPSVFIDSILTELFYPGQDGGVSSAPAPLRRRLIAEFLGSAFLAAVVIGSGIAAQRLSPDATGLELLENAAVTAAGLYAIILMFGPVSGGHFNPAVSFADAARARPPGAAGAPLGRHLCPGPPLGVSSPIYLPVKSMWHFCSLSRNFV